MNLIGRHCVVEIDGEEYDSWKDGGLINGVTVTLNTDKSGEAIVALADPRFIFTDAHLDASGLRRAKVRVWMGFGEKAQLGPPLFEGLLSGHDHDGAIATFAFDDHLSRMKQKKRSRYHINKSDLDVMRSLAGEYGYRIVISKDVPDSEVNDCLIQWGQTDWQFFMETARRCGLRVYMQGQTLYVQEAGRTGEAVVDLVYGPQSGDDASEFVMMRGIGLSHKLPENKKGRPGRVEVRTRGRGGRMISGDDGDSDTRGGDHVHVEEDLPHHTERAARRRARARRSLHREDAFDHRIRLLPAFLRSHVPLRQGETVRLLGVGQFYSGTYIIRSARYIYDTNQYAAELSLKRDIAKKKATKNLRRRQ